MAKVKHPDVFVKGNENAVKAVHVVIEEFRNDSLPNVPKDTGVLQRSARTRVERTKKGARSELSYNTSYAEEQWKNHATKSKWGEKTWKKERTRYNGIIKNIMGAENVK